MRDVSFDTLAVHQSIKNKNHFTSKATPIYQTSSFSFKNLYELESYFEGETPYLYTRYGNPNTDELGAAVAALEGADAGAAASSGMSAILAGILAVAKNGDHIVACDDLYGGTYHLLDAELKNFGINVTFVSFANEQEIRDAICDHTKLLYTESITNPFLRAENIQMLVNLAKEFNIATMVDNTFATPYVLQPYKDGVDLVVHSATKYLGGHSDVSAGVIVGSEDLMQSVCQKIISLGANLSPFEAWLTCRGIKTLALRMEKQNKNAQFIADELKQNAYVQKVYFPEKVSKEGNGAIVTIELSSQCDVHTFFASLGWIKIVPSLGGVETSVSYPLGTSHRTLPPEAQEKLGINARVIRISIGIENPKEILNQLITAIETSLN
ncbi:trans-sulfuration enzyme family protein [Lederbergia wuyishanensis]|uniref:Cystathionine beta-lyase/cystathionine gamma-synthase n=1 Tax=Lederbergia wuyishanensis TaxID=1347903 RepID=A0ABU0D7D3_9BACI|nr:PLP-dependent aspartate aminotransferase family protein [Lederbergia wuyishanensis]MCJ8008994.1 PLP-dependent aspartate aminotransferase family protein [Lederbergia wuyishanensis]MDQ0344324.1 cystathionine beta-lyase/cystathionine gamma-synthase [Lederbergia wuyishanensis]